MRFEELLSIIGHRGWFDVQTVTQLVDETKEAIRVQLHRWLKAGKLIPLRRGMYAFSERYRRVEVNPAELANHLYAPSYLSLQWALGYYGLIPEGVVAFTSVTSRQTKRFENDFGEFRYRHVKSEAFFGCQPLSFGDRRALVATPEKALLDLWHLESGEWDSSRMSEMRFQNVNLVKIDALIEQAKRFSSPRMEKTVKVWAKLVNDDLEEGVEL